jgi:hypothetical protein
MLKISFVTITCFAAAACTNTEETGDDAVTSAGAEQQLSTSGGKGDDATAKSTDPRLVNCQLEYQAITPTFTTRTAGAFDQTFGSIENTFGVASDAAYSLQVSTNKHAPYNLSFIAQIFDVKTSKQLAYIVLPRPHVGGAFLFELGAQIPATTFEDTGAASFDTLRAYCSIRMP